VAHATAWRLLLPIIVGLLVLMPRVDGWDFIDRYLWAEDGLIFIAEASGSGADSLLTPYSGYLHLYPRFFAWLSSKVDLAFTPLIYFCAWLMAFMLMTCTVFARLTDNGVKPAFAVAVVALIALQPHSGETLFSLTNAQWYLAIALAVLLLLDGPRRPGRRDVPLLLLLGFTGPFSVVMVPLLALKAMLLRDLRRNRASYGTIAFCAVVQAAFIAHSGRGGAHPMDPDPSHWWIALQVFFLFGQEKRVVAPALALWGALAVLLAQALSKSRGNAGQQGVRALLLVLAAGVFFAGGLWASKQFPQILSPLGPGARYYVVPYGLVLAAVGVAGVGRRAAETVAVAAFAVVCALQFRVVDRPSVQFPAFAAFSKAMPELTVPINPRWPEYPGWHIPVTNPQPLAARYFIYDDGFSLDEVVQTGQGGGRDVVEGRATGSDPKVLLNGALNCGSSRFVGIDAKLWRERAGWVQLFWSRDGRFEERESLLRFYPPGTVQAQFAFANPPDGVRLRLDPLTEPGPLRIGPVRVYCLD
jgi:hypothetical protein